MDWRRLGDPAWAADRARGCGVRVTVAGRPPEVAGIENMVGLFINTLPLRVQLPPGTPLLELLRQVQASQSRLMEHQHLGLAEVQGLAGLGELFDTLVVFENYPVDRAGLSAQVGGLRLTDFRGLDATHYPLSLAAHPGERLQLQLSYRPTCSIARALRRLRAGSTFWALRSVTPSCGSGTRPQSFDAALWEMAAALAGGAALVLIAPGKRSGDALAHPHPCSTCHPCDLTPGAAARPA